jgi:predicted RNA methylase
VPLDCLLRVLAFVEWTLRRCSYTIGFDVDTAALDIAQANRREYDLEDDVDFVQCDILAGVPARLRGACVIDTVVMNPPFGTKIKSADMGFLRAAFEVRCAGALVVAHFAGAT